MGSISDTGVKPTYDMSGEEKPSLSQSRSKTSATAEVLAGEMYDERYGGTQRGLKSRHAQMIALGGKLNVPLTIPPIKY